MNLSFKKILFFALLFFVLILLIQFFLTHPFDEKVPLRVSFLDVGQGDAILIDYQEQYQVLIDSGLSGKKVLSELNRAMPPQDKTIEVLIATHYDKDHIGGMRSVLENYQTQLFLDNGDFSETNAVTLLTDLIEAKKIDSRSIKEDSRIEFGEDFFLEFFNPDGDDWSANENSVVARLDFRGNSFLFTGDVGFKAEKDLMADGHDLDVDWLKVGHHGSKNSSAEDFLRQVSPQGAIISVGAKNSYGHPAEETLDRLRAVGAEIFNTAENGTIIFECFEECGLAK